MLVTSDLTQRLPKRKLIKNKPTFVALIFNKRKVPPGALLIYQ